MMGARNHNPCVQLSPDIKPTELHLLQLFFFRDLIEGVLLHNINVRIQGDNVSYGDSIVFIGVSFSLSLISGLNDPLVCSILGSCVSYLDKRLKEH